LLAVALLPVEAMVQGHARPKTSSITIHVHKSGLFSAFGHEHTVAAPIARGRLNPKARTVEIVVATKQMKVVDADASEKDRAEIQATMLGPGVLDTDKFPEIRFQSSHVEDIDGNRYRVTGKLELRGVAREFSFEVHRNVEGVYEGRTKLKQTAFGIQPVSVAGGTVKVKDELEIEFHIREGELDRIGSSVHREVGAPGRGRRP
jgi:polyisoprenoid-binding protein YceI